MDPIEAFLDAVDEVLNSNTFLVRIPLPSGDILEDVRTFITSGELQKALLHADVARGWYNFHYYTAGGDLEPITGNLANPECRLTKRQTNLTAPEYLEAILRADSRKGNFISFYQKAKSAAAAGSLTASLLAAIFADNTPELHLLEPDFFVNASAGPEQIYYFENKGCDNVALLVHKSEGYMLLTNGMP